MHVHESTSYSFCASTNAAICVSAHCFAQAPQAQVVKVKRALKDVGHVAAEVLNLLGLGGSKSYVRFRFGC
jgi:hypothetical protein